MDVFVLFFIVLSCGGIFSFFFFRSFTTQQSIIEQFERNLYTRQETMKHTFLFLSWFLGYIRNLIKLCHGSYVMKLIFSIATSWFADGAFYI